MIVCYKSKFNGSICKLFICHVHCLFQSYLKAVTNVRIPLPFEDMIFSHNNTVHTIHSSLLGSNTV